MSSLPLHPTLPATAAVADVLSPAPAQPCDILDRLRSRDTSALLQITRQYGPAMTRAAYLHLGDAHAAEDAVQEALIAAWDGVHRTRITTSLWPWLLGITLNRCRKHLRTLVRRRRREQHAHAMQLSCRNESTTGHAAEQADALRLALLQLPEPLRCVIILRFEQGLSVAQSADALGLPQGTVKRRCHDAIRRLRTIMGANT